MGPSNLSYWQIIAMFTTEQKQAIYLQINALYVDDHHVIDNVTKWLSLKFTKMSLEHFAVRLFITWWWIWEDNGLGLGGGGGGEKKKKIFFFGWI